MVMFTTADFTKVLCPKCGAKAGSSCRSASGRKICALYPHIDRVRAFVADRRLIEEQITPGIALARTADPRYLLPPSPGSRLLPMQGGLRNISGQSAAPARG